METRIKRKIEIGNDDKNKENINKHKTKITIK